MTKNYVNSLHQNSVLFCSGNFIPWLCLSYHMQSHVQAMGLNGVVTTVNIVNIILIGVSQIKMKVERSRINKCLPKLVM